MPKTHIFLPSCLVREAGCNVLQNSSAHSSVEPLKARPQRRTGRTHFHSQCNTYQQQGALMVFKQTLTYNYVHCMLGKFHKTEYKPQEWLYIHEKHHIG